MEVTAKWTLETIMLWEHRRLLCGVVREKGVEYVKVRKKELPNGGEQRHHCFLSQKKTKAFLVHLYARLCLEKGAEHGEVRESDVTKPADNIEDREREQRKY